MDEQVMSPNVEAPTTEPSTAESVPAPAAEGPDTTGLPEDAANAFSKKWAATKSKLEQEIRAQLEQEYAQKYQPPQEVQQYQPPMNMPPQELAPQAPAEFNLDEDVQYQQMKLLMEDAYYNNDIALALEKAAEMREYKLARQEAHTRAQWQHHMQALASRYPDTSQLVSRMQELVKQMPDLAERPEHLERVYKIAKMVAPPNPNQLLSDPAFLTQAKDRILQDQTMVQSVKDALRNQIIEEYVSQKRTAAETTPPMMGSNVGGASPTMPPSTPKSWAEARRSAMERLGMRNG